jgi:hypothetical protein
LPSFKGACTRGIYDNMKTAVETVFVGKERQFNRRFLQMCSHYLIEPVACTPAAGWEKGQVENQVGLVRERFFTPRLRVSSYEELNALLLDRCVAYAKAHASRAADQTVWQVFEAERAHWCRYAGRFDGFHAVTGAVSKTCLVRFDNNKYSVSSRAVGRPVEVQAYADRIVIRQDGRLSASTSRFRPRPRRFTIPGITCRCWPASRGAAQRRAVQGLGAAGKPGAGAAQAEGLDDGDRQMVDILAAVLDRRPDGVEAACAEALRRASTPPTSSSTSWRASASPGPAVTILTPEALRLRHAPVADCAATTACGGQLMERTEIFDLMGALKLYGMRAAFDEIMAAAGQAPARAAAHCR